MLCVVCACPCPSSCRLPVAPPPRPSTSRRLLIVDSIVNGVVVATTAAALDRLWPPLQPKMITLRWTTGSNCCCPQPLPFLPGRRSEGRSVRQRPSIVSVAAMLAGGDDGLPPSSVVVAPHRANRRHHRHRGPDHHPPHPILRLIVVSLPSPIPHPPSPALPNRWGARATLLRGRGGCPHRWHFFIVDFFIDQGPHAFSHRNYGPRTNKSPIMATSPHQPRCAPCGDVAIIGDSYVLTLQYYCRGVKAY